MGKSVERVPKAKAVPPLRDGDCLDTNEFLRRYQSMPEGFRAELLAGVVYVNRWFETNEKGVRVLMSPISTAGHAEEQFSFAEVFGAYKRATPGVRGAGPTTLVLADTESCPEPDGIFYIEADFGGQTTIGPKGYLHGPPELVLEIANTSGNRDLGVKFDQYERAGVQEYVVWLTQSRTIQWFQRNRAGRFVPLKPRSDGVVCSQVFPGLWIDPAALIARNAKRVYEVIDLGLASPEHAAFAAKLQVKAEQN